MRKIVINNVGLVFVLLFVVTGLKAQSQVTLEKVNNQYKEAHRILNEAGYLAPFGKNTFSKLPNDEGTSDYLTKRVICKGAVALRKMIQDIVSLELSSILYLVYVLLSATALMIFGLVV